MRKKIDIKKQLMIRYISLIIVFGILTLGAGVNLAKKILIENSAVLLSNFAKETGKNISNVIRLEIQNVEIIADTPLLHNAQSAEEEKLAYLREIVEKYDYKKAALIDLEGNCRTINGEEVNVADLEYFQRGLKGESSLTTPYFSKADGGLQIAISTPIIDNGKVTGILFFSKNAEDFSDITNQLTFGETGTAYVVDENGTNIINRDINKVIQKVNRIEDAKTDPSYAELGAITEQMIAGKSGTGSYMLDGERKFLGYAPVPINGWAVGVTVELQDMLAGVSLVRVYMSLFALIIIICMIILTYRISDGFSKRLLSVQNEVKKMASGDFTLNKKKYKIMDEISEIDYTLQQAKASLSEMIERIQVSGDKKKEYNSHSKKDDNKTE